MANPANLLRVRVLFFARASELAGTAHGDLNLPSPATARDAEAAIHEAYPRIRDELKVYRIAVDQEFATPDAPVHDGSEVAIIPPVSGG